jgi:hypothetical protein
MAFCSNCGTQLKGDERFCEKCGTDVSAKTAAAPAAPAPAPPPPPQVHPVAVAPPPYAAPAPYPVAVAVPPPAPAKSGNTIGTIVILAILAGGGYYWYTHRPPVTPPAAPSNPPATPPSSAPANPQAPPAAGTEATLVKAQTFAATWKNTAGFVEIDNSKWTNGGTVAIQSATLECDQISAANAILDSMRTTLNGPNPPGDAMTFNPFQMGATVAATTHVNCYVVHVKQVAQ